MTNMYRRRINYLSGKMGFKPVFKKSNKPVVIDDSIAVKEIVKPGKIYIEQHNGIMFRFKTKNELSAEKIIRRRQSNAIKSANFVDSNGTYYPLYIRMDDVFRCAIK